MNLKAKLIILIFLLFCLSAFLVPVQAQISNQDYSHEEVIDPKVVGEMDNSSGSTSASEGINMINFGQNYSNGGPMCGDCPTPEEILRNLIRLGATMLGIIGLFLLLVGFLIYLVRKIKHGVSVFPRKTGIVGIVFVILSILTLIATFFLF